MDTLLKWANSEIFILCMEFLMLQFNTFQKKLNIIISIAQCVNLLQKKPNANTNSVMLLTQLLL